MTTIREVEIKLEPTQQTKLFLVRTMSGAKSTTTVDALKNLLQLAQFQLSRDRDILIRDEYLDTRDLSFYSKGISCRIRHTGSEISLQLKTPAQIAKVDSVGYFDRQEQTAAISSEQYDAVLTQRRLPDAFKAMFDSEMPEMRVVCEVTNARSTYKMQRDDQLYELSIDCCSFRNPVSSYRLKSDFVEIEIEALNDAGQKASPALRNDLKKILNQQHQFSFSTESKYQRAVDGLKLARPRIVQNIYGSDTEFGVGVGLIGLVTSTVAATAPNASLLVGVCLLLALLIYFHIKK